MLKDFFQKHFRLIFLVCFILAVIFTAEFLGFREQLSVERVRAIFEQNKIVSSLLFILLFSLGGAIQVPGFVFLTAATIALGSNQGLFLTYVAAVVAGIFNFYFVSLIAGDSLQKIEAKWVQLVLAKIHQAPLFNMTILRLMMQVSPPLNYALALTGVKLRDYVLAIVIGLPLPYFIFTLLIGKVGHLLR